MKYREEKFPMTTTGFAVLGQTQKKLIEDWKEYIKWKKENQNDIGNNFRMREKFQGFVDIYLSSIRHNRGIINSDNSLFFYNMRKEDLDRAYNSLEILIMEHNLNGDLYLTIHRETKYPGDFDEFRKKLNDFKNIITNDKNYCDRLGKAPYLLNPAEFGIIFAVASVVAWSGRLGIAVAAFPPAIGCFLAVFLACGISTVLIRSFSQSISQVIDKLLVTGLYCYRYHPKEVMIGGTIVSMIGLTAFAYRGYLRIAISWLAKNNDQILLFIKNKGIDIKNLDGETILSKTLYPLLQSIRNKYLEKLRLYLPKDCTDYISDKLISDTVLKEITDFLISIFITKNTKTFQQSGVNSIDDSSMWSGAPKLEEGAIDQLGNIYKTFDTELDSIDKAAKSGFVLSPDEHKHVHLFDQKSLSDLISFKGLVSLGSSLVTSGTFAPKSLSSSTSGVSIQSIQPIRAKL